MAAAVANPPDATSPWLHLAAPIGRVATYFLIGGSFLQLFAPLAFLVDVQSRTNPYDSGGNLLYLLTDPGHLLAIGDFVMILGTVILVAALFLILLALIRAERRVPLDAFLLGSVVLGCLAVWVPAMLVSQGIARGTVASVDAAAATGGWGLASLLLLVASVAYLFFAIRVENGTGVRRLGSLKWPIYAAVNVLGTAALAGFFQSGGGNLDAFSLGLALKLTLIPMLGVMAYSDLRDRFPAWSRLPLMAVRVAARPVVRPVPAPAKPMVVTAIVRPLPPPPDD